MQIKSNKYNGLVKYVIKPSPTKMELFIFIKSAYKHMPYPFEYTSDWKLLLTSDECNTSEYGYYGIAYINKIKKLVVIAHCGTDITWNLWELGKDLYSGLQVLRGDVPSQYINGTEKFLTRIIEIMKSQSSTYNYINTGHSLGAVLADLSTLKLSLSYYKSSSIDFENPGTRPILENYLEILKERGYILRGKIKNLKLDITEYNLPKNMFNSMHPHAGSKIYQIENFNEKTFLQAIKDKINPFPTQHFFNKFILNIDRNTAHFPKVSRTK